MAMSRSFGGTWLTTRPPIAISPLVISSSPATIRSRVDLPQPEGPTRTTNSPSGMSISTPCRMCVLPKYLSTLRISTDAICLSDCGAAARRLYLVDDQCLQPAVAR